MRPSPLDDRVVPLLVTRGPGQLTAACYGLGALSLLSGIARFLLDGMGSAVGVILVLCAVGFAAAPHLARWFGVRAEPGAVVPAIGLLGIGAAALLDGGLYSEGLFWLPLVPVIAAITGGTPRSTVGLTAAATVLILLLVALQLGGTIPAPVDTSGVDSAAFFIRAVGLTGATLAGGAIGWAIETTWHDAAVSLQQRADNHPVTRLPSRAAFDRTMRSALGRAQRDGDRIGLAYIDLNDFKAINDRHGHLVGDHALKLVGNMLRRMARDGETPFHLAGDEFAVLLEGTPAWELDRVAARFSVAIKKIRAGDTIPEGLSASVGVAMSMHGDSVSDLVVRADRTMYASKMTGDPTVDPDSSFGR